ncbi:MAG TPA: winged helix-turn-helix domain-containing protein [Candidatus Sulfotelmatobacter sp.]|jgi:TolB-like protein/DNA-binding winged helix-turn-helix (wHTH) protein/Tfp pilus assembly protein PilF|nr:winged helix-turn-helix domain-containing protein [Candidatus Sulfotelmatobacter sp.]
MASTAPAPSRLCFDVFELDARAGELRKHGVKLRLQGQPLKVLATLLNRAGDVVTRDELRAEIWADDTFVDFDHSLHNAIARLREVLGDSAETPRYIETLPRRGYRFIGPVQGAVRSPSRSSQAEQPGELPVDLRLTKYRKLLATAFLALLVIGLAVWLAGTGTHPTGAAPSLNSVAVLPLENLSGEPSEEFFVDGMTDQLITDLAKVGSLRVISRASVMQYKGTRKGLPEIAHELNVDAIVEGSVVRSGQRVRVTAQLVQAPTDHHLWAETYDRDLGDILKLQGEVTDAIAGQVRAHLTPTQQALIRRAHAVNPGAYDAYLKGRLYFVNEYTKPDSLKKAQRYFEESIQKDPNLALAYAGLADTYVYLAFAGAMQRDLAYRSAKEALAKALALDDSIGEAYDTLGLLSFAFDWDWDTADREFNRAIALAPSYSCTHEDRAIFLAVIGRRAEALAELTKVQQLDYGFSAGHTESATYYELQDYPNLIESSKRGLLLDPNDWSQRFSLAVGYEGTGKVLEAISEYRKAMEISGNSQIAVALAHAYSATGRKADAEKILHDLERKFKETSASPYTMATIYAGLGENDKAFRFLEKAYSEKSLDLFWSLNSDLLLDSLRPDPRFQSLLRRMGLTG